MTEENATNEVIKDALENDKFAYAVAGGTTVTGIVSNITELQSWLSISATAFGLLLTMVLVIKHGIGVIQAWKELNKP